MSKYEVDKALWQSIRQPDARRQLHEEPDAFFADRDLTEEERRAVQEGDIRALYSMGAIPFLVYQSALQRVGVVTPAVLGEYVGKLQGCAPADITT